MANVTRAQAERFFKKFCAVNHCDADDTLAPPELVENFDGYRWSIYWDWADFSYPEEMGGTIVPDDFKGFYAERVNSQRIALYPL